MTSQLEKAKKYDAFKVPGSDDMWRTIGEGDDFVEAQTGLRDRQCFTEADLKNAIFYKLTQVDEL